MLYKILLAAALSPSFVAAADLACVPDTMCIDDDCQAGHDDKAAILLLDWQNPKPVLQTNEGDVQLARKDKLGKMRWVGLNANNQSETLTVGKSNMHFTYEIRLEPGSAANTLTARGACMVQK